MHSDEAKQALAELCQTIGQRIPNWTQGPGGNVSIKADGGESLWIKASGSRLSDITSDRGLARVKLPEFLEAWSTPANRDTEQKYSSLLVRCADAGPRPSMEAGFHALLPKRYVVHFHPLSALLWTDEVFSEPRQNPNPDRGSFAATFMGQPVRVLSAQMPGKVLTETIADELSVGIPEEILLLQNHGVILQSNDPKILGTWEKLEKEYLVSSRFRDKARILSGENALDPALPSPLRIYLPDTAVYLDRIRKILRSSGLSTEGEELFVSDPELARADRDAAEIWEATRVLFFANPKLGVMPETISASVATLPTELYRRRECH